ncbi:MAG TPA: DNA polymerase I [Alphaproteobacteria bacterium]
MAQTPCKTLYLIDGSGFIFRAYHALPGLTRPDGTPVGAVMGFCNMLIKIIEESSDGLLAVIFDSARRNFRHDIYPEYKANRGETPEDLIPQFPLIRQATAAFGVTSIELEGYEADDLIAAYAHHAVAEGCEAKIVSGDKDLMQLIRPGVQLLDPFKFATITPDMVIAKFGVTPDKVVDVQALAGDSSDNVPGVPGIGVKTAAELINQFGDLETLLANAGTIKQPKRRESLIEFADKARISKKLVQLAHDMPIPLPFSELIPHTPDMHALRDFLTQQEFRSILNRAEKRWGNGAPPPKKFDPPHASGITQTMWNDHDVPSAAPEMPAEPGIKNYELVTTQKDLDRWIAKIKKAGLVAIDTETNSLTPAKADLVGICLSVTPGEACYIPLQHQGAPLDLLSADVKPFVQLPLKETLEQLQPVLSDPAILKVAHNFKYDSQIFQRYGLNVTPFDDTMIMSYVLFGAQHGHGLDEITLKYIGHENISYTDVVGKGVKQKTFSEMAPEDVREYACEDADMTLRLYQILQPLLAQQKKMALYHELDKPLIPILAQMESTGITVDTHVLRRLSQDFATKIDALEKQIHQEAGQEFNIASPKQMGEILFGAMGLPAPKKTKTGAYATDAKTLEELSLQGHEIVNHILEWRQFSKLRSTYTDALQQQIVPRTGRVHTSFAQSITNTGRLSSNDPNLQNIPIRTEEGRKIRTAFVPEKGKILLCADYSQIELRLIAEMAGIDRLKQAFTYNIDIHTLTASEVFGIPLDQITREERRAAKAINFGIIYGISGFGLARQLGTENHVAAAYIKQYMERFPQLRTYMDETKKFAKDHGYVLTLLGRQCHMPGINSKNGAERGFAERQAINAPIQGTAADIVKMAMIAVDDLIRTKNLPANLLLQVHDELVLEVDQDAATEIAPQIKQAMESVMEMSVPLVVDTGTGPNWDEAH